MTSFFHTLFSPYEKGYIDLRFMDGTSSPIDKFVPLHDYTQAAKLCRAFDNQGWDCYCGVLPRDTTTNGKKSNISIAHWLWSDIDYKRVDPEEALKLAKDADYIVGSGGGIHAYYKLTEPAVLKGDERKRFEGLLQQRQRLLKSDPVHNIDRILRVPGTHNYKYDPPREVTVVRECDATIVSGERNWEDPAYLASLFGKLTMSSYEWDYEDVDTPISTTTQWLDEAWWYWNAKAYNDEVNARKHQRIMNLLAGDIESGVTHSTRNPVTGHLNAD